jgi:hypothetical protein
MNASKFSNSGFKAPSTSTTTASMTDKVSGMLSKVKGLFGGNSGVIVAFVVLMLAFLLVIIYIVSQLRNNSYKKGKALTSKVINLNDGNEPVEIPGSTLETQTMGAQYSFSFWLFVRDFVRTPFHKLVLYRGEKGNVSTANPIVLMDKDTNKLYFVLQPMGESLNTVAGANYENLLDITKQNYYLQSNLKYGDATTNKHIIVPVNNVPLNRPVHFVLSVKDNIVTVFMNGELHSGNTVNDIYLSRTPTVDDVTRPLDAPILQNNLNGSIFIGKNQTLGGGYGLDGFLSKLGYYNYAMTVEDVYKIYKQGPVSNNSLLSAMGINQYGMRSPFYKLAVVA